MLLMSGDLLSQCDIPEIAAASLKFEENSDKLVNRKTRRDIRSSTKRHPKANFVVLDFSKVLQAADSVGLTERVGDSWDIVWHRLDPKSAVYIYQLEEQDSWTVYFVEIIYNCMWIRFPVISGSDYYVMDRTYKETDEEGYDFWYADLTWTMLEDIQLSKSAPDLSFEYWITYPKHSHDDSLELEYINRLPLDSMTLDVLIYNLGEVYSVYIQKYPQELFEFGHKWEWNAFMNVYSATISPLNILDQPFLIVHSSKGEFRFPIIPFYCGMAIEMSEGTNKLVVQYQALRMRYLE